MPSDEIDDQTSLALVMRAKAELRKRLRALRQTTPASACAKRSERIVERLLELEVLARASRVALFWPIEARHEVDLRPLDPTLRDRGVSVFYPSAEEETRVMTFRAAHPSELVDDALGFRGAPPTALEATALDVIIVPALALDAQGRRLGYGAGFYDRSLVRFGSAVAVGVVYDFQLLAEVPSLATDISMGWVVTDARTLNCVERPS
jgi:5-formyltetrahydrofolate cyclo-ligase